jgi:hypothetical protein
MATVFRIPEFDPAHRRPRHDRRLDDDLEEAVRQREKAKFGRAERVAEDDARQDTVRHAHGPRDENVQRDRTQFAKMAARPAEGHADGRGNPDNDEFGEPLRQNLQRQGPDAGSGKAGDDANHAQDRANGQFLVVQRAPQHRDGHGRQGGQHGHGGKRPHDEFDFVIPEQTADRGGEGAYQKAQSERDRAVGEIGSRGVHVIQLIDRHQCFDRSLHERELAEADEDRADRKQAIGARTEDRRENGEQDQPEDLLRDTFDRCPGDRRQGRQASKHRHQVLAACGRAGRPPGAATEAVRRDAGTLAKPSGRRLDWRIRPPDIARPTPLRRGIEELRARMTRRPALL